MQSRCSVLKVYPETLRKLNKLLYRNGDNNINTLKKLSLMELDDQNPTCKCKIFLEMPPLTHTHVYTSILFPGNTAI